MSQSKRSFFSVLPLTLLIAGCAGTANTVAVTGPGAHQDSRSLASDGHAREFFRVGVDSARVGRCYRVDREGRYLGTVNDYVDPDNCTAGFAVGIDAARIGRCYKVDEHGNFIGTVNDYVEARNCYSSYRTGSDPNGVDRCYRVDRKGNYIGTINDYVDASKCD